MGLVAALRLVRLPNTLTAAADVIAGAAIVGMDPLSPPVLVAATGSALLYAGGMALNDLLDVEKDRRENPDRVLPSGALSIAAAGALAIVLLVSGAATAAAAPTVHLLVTLGLVAAIIIYDTLPEGPRLRASFVMGSCRALNIARGMTLGGVALQGTPDGLAIATHLALILMVTVVSTFERSSVRGSSYRVALVAMPACYLVPALVGSSPLGSWLALAGGFVLGAWVSRPGYGASGRPILVVKRAIFTLVLFDALYAVAVEEWVAAAVLAALLPVILGLARAIGQKGS